MAIHRWECEIKLIGSNANIPYIELSDSQGAPYGIYFRTGVVRRLWVGYINNVNTAIEVDTGRDLNLSQWYVFAFEVEPAGNVRWYLDSSLLHTAAVSDLFAAPIFFAETFNCRFAGVGAEARLDNYLYAVGGVTYDSCDFETAEPATLWNSHAGLTRVNEGGTHGQVGQILVSSGFTDALRNPYAAVQVSSRSSIFGDVYTVFCYPHVDFFSEFQLRQVRIFRGDGGQLGSQVNSQFVGKYEGALEILPDDSKRLTFAEDTWESRDDGEIWSQVS